MDDTEKRKLLTRMMWRAVERGDWAKYAAIVRELWLMQNEWARKTYRPNVIDWQYMEVGSPSGTPAASSSPGERGRVGE